MNIIHIGLGNRGKRWILTARENPNLVSVGCVDPDSSALDWVRTHFPKVPYGTDLHTVLYKVNADAAVIAGSPWVRAGETIKALEAGLAVLAEFPFAMSLTDAARVLDVSQSTGKPLLIAGSGTIPCVSVLRGLLDDKKLGAITHVSWIDHRFVSSEAEASVPYSQLVSIGVNHLQALRQILGTDPVSLISRCSRSSWSQYQHGSTTEAFVRMQNGIHVQYHGSLTSNQNEHILFVEGDKGALKAEKSRVWWRKRGWRFFLPLSLRKFSLQELWQPDSLLTQLGAGVRDELPSNTSDEDNLQMIATLEAVMKSDKTGKVVEIPSVPTALKVASLKSLA